MSRTRLVRRMGAVVLLCATFGCATARPAPESTAPDGREREIVATLQASAQAWNRGDLDGFLQPYLDSPATSYIERDVVRGVPAIRASYAGSWFRTGRPAGELAYDRIEVRPLGRDYALVVGHWTVTNRETHQPRGGIFSLTWFRSPRGWRIIHDHSS